MNKKQTRDANVIAQKRHTRDRERLKITVEEPIALDVGDLNLEYGLLLWAKGDKDTALKYIMEAISLKPEYSHILEELGF